MLRYPYITISDNWHLYGGTQNGRYPKTELFEKLPVPKAVMKLAIPTIISSLVMVIYNLADTYFVGNAWRPPSQNAAVTLAAPVLSRVQTRLTICSG